MTTGQQGMVGITTVLVITVGAVLAWGPTPPDVAAPKAFSVAAELVEGTPKAKVAPEPKRPVPEAPQTAPEGAHTLSSTGLSIWDVRPGEGQPAREGQVVTVDFTAWTLEGQRFDSSFYKDDPLRFALGAGRVIPGLDEGVRGLRRGGVRQLLLPPDLAFGENGIPKRVPPNSTVVYEIALIDILDIPTAPPSGAATTLAEGLSILDVAIGNGPEATQGRRVVVDYILWHEGEQLDTSLDRPRGVSVEAGIGKLFPGWDQGMLGMKAGGHRAIFTEPNQAFGATGSPPMVPPNAALVVELWMRRVDE